MCDKRQMIDVMTKYGFVNIKTYEETKFGKNYIALYGDCACGLGTSGFCLEFSECIPHEPTMFEQLIIKHIENDKREGRWLCSH